MKPYEDFEQDQESKYLQALDQYNTSIKDEDVKKAVEKLIAERVPENNTKEVKKFLLGSVELTTLKTTDSDKAS